jgi:hypothetical protein
MIRKGLRLLVSFFALATVLWAMTVNGSLAVLGTLTAGIVDFSGATKTVAAKQSLTSPAACAAGETYFNTTSKALHLCIAPDTWAQVQTGAGTAAVDVLDLRQVEVKDEFFTLLSASGAVYSQVYWSTRNIGSPSGASITQANGTSANPGVMRLTTGNVPSTGIIVSSDSYNYDKGRLDPRANNWEACGVFALSQSTQIRARIGVAITGESYLPTDTTNKVWLYYNATSTAGNWHAQVGAYAGTQGDWDTGVAADTIFHSACWSGDGAKVYVQMDGGTKRSFCPSGCDVTATIPDGSSNAYALVAAAMTNDAASKWVDVDYLGYARTLPGALARRRN